MLKPYCLVWYIDHSLLSKYVHLYIIQWKIGCKSTSITLCNNRRSHNFNKNFIIHHDQGRIQGGRTRRAPPLKLEKIWFFGVKSWFFTRNTPKIFAPPSARRNFFKCAPPNLKSWIRPWWSHIQSLTRPQRKNPRNPFWFKEKTADSTQTMKSKTIASQFFVLVYTPEIYFYHVVLGYIFSLH